MSIETEIQTEVDALRARYSDTKALYREVSALLFFKHGITPTAGKLYQFVRKGSMSAPADALAKFWDELRSKARVEIDHPDLPPALATTAAQAVGEIWRQAVAAARGELAAARLEAQSAVEAAQVELNIALASAKEAEVHTELVRVEHAATTEAAKLTAAELEVERRSHGATTARLLELQRHFDEAKLELERSRDRFTSDLSLAKEAAKAAAARSEVADRRALVEVDQERQARSKAEKATETVRGQAAQTEDRLRTEIQGLTDLNVKLAARAEAAEATNRTVKANLEETAATVDRLSGELRSTQDEAARAKTEAHTLQGVIDRLSVAPVAVVKTSKPKKT